MRGKHVVCRLRYFPVSPLSYPLWTEDLGGAKGGRGGGLRRWRELLFEKGALPLAQWRKSAQWFGLTRPHAQLVAADTQVPPPSWQILKTVTKEAG